MHAALQHCSKLVLSPGFARNSEFSVVTLSANSVTMSLSPNQEQQQGDFPEHTLFVKVPTVMQLCMKLVTHLIKCTVQLNNILVSTHFS